MSSPTIRARYKNAGKPVDLNPAVDSHLSVLDRMEAKGVDLPYGCRSGACGACRVTVLRGMELLTEQGPMETDTLNRCKDESNVRLACRALFKPNASGVLELEPAPEVGVLPTGSDYY